MTKQKEILTRLRKAFYVRNQFLEDLSKKLDMFIFLNEEQRKRGILVLRKEIKKELRGRRVKQQLEGEKGK